MPTDYSTSCGNMPLTFIQMLASLIRGYHDIAGLLHYRLNSLVYSDNCTELSDFMTCDVSHVEAERQLVENTFALDACDLLAWKIFSNGDNDWEDYSDCGEVPQSLIQMLYRCIVTYGGANKINTVIDTDVCTSLEELLTCTVNDIEAERMLVTNLFAVDDCDRLLIKFFANTSTMTDYSIACTESNQSFYKMLARCIVLYDGHYYLNIAVVSGNCDDLHPFWTCDNNNIDPESALVSNIFATDSCGHLAIKMFNNQGGREQ
jgi:hypothetical protein